MGRIVKLALGMVATLLACAAEPTPVPIAAEPSAVPIAAVPFDAALIAAGKRLFVNCAACHTFQQNAAHGVGPNLWGVFGSKAGTKPDFVYSDALVDSAIVWTEETIGKYIENPATFLPGNLMGFAGMANEQDRKALLAFLQRKTTED